MITIRTPLRVSFFGGGTDFPKWYNQNGGGVLSCAINKYTYVPKLIDSIIKPYFNWTLQQDLKKSKSLN